MNNKYSLKQEILEELNCPICLSPMVDPTMTDCLHVFCKICITKWLKLDDKSCPCCKKYVLTSNLKASPREIKKMVFKLANLQDIELNLPIIKQADKKRSIELICLDNESFKRPIPMAKKSSINVPVVFLD